GDVAPGHALALQPVGDVGGDVEVGEQRVRLEHHVDRRRYGGTAVMSWPSMTMRPSSGVSKPAIMRNRVVLPQPEPPSRANSSPCAISRSTPSTAATAPKRLRTVSILTMGPVTAST